MSSTEGDEVEVASEEIVDDDADPAVHDLAENMAAAAKQEAFIEVPVTADEPMAEEKDEKTEDQVTEIEEDKQNMGARVASVDEFKDIPIDKDEDAPRSQASQEESVVEASVVEEVSEQRDISE